MRQVLIKLLPTFLRRELPGSIAINSVCLRKRYDQLISTPHVAFEENKIYPDPKGRYLNIEDLVFLICKRADNCL